jgi:predicted DNA-binding protein (UPF0251 family)
MPRPSKWRTVAAIPSVTYFKPAGIPLRLLSEVRLAVEEMEAIRLKDLEGLEQEDCAQRMSISRPTFHRVLKAARRKIADAFMNGRAIRVEGGNFAAPGQMFRCAAYGHAWEISPEPVVPARPLACPICGSARVGPATAATVSPVRHGLRRGRGPGGGRWRGEGG